MSDYHDREMRRFRAECEGFQKAPLAERKEAAKELLLCWTETPEFFIERASWVLEGSYGYGAYQTAKQILASRGNKIAQLSQLTALVEWGCPNASTVWKKLTAEQQAKLATGLQSLIEEQE